MAQNLRYDYFFLEALKQQEKENYAAAFDLLQHAKELNPEAAEVYFQLAGYYVDMKQDSMVRSCFERASQLNPNNDTYQERLAQFQITQREYNKAIETYEHLYESHRNRDDVLQILFRLYSAQNDYEKMISTLNRMELLEGSSEQLTLTKMQIYEQQGEKGKVFRELKSLVTKHPNDLNYRVMLGNWLLQNDKPEAALKEYKAVMKEEPENELAQISMLDYYRAKKQGAKADELLSQLLKNKKTESETKVALMRQAIQENEESNSDSTKIFRLFDEVLSQPQQNADLILLKAAYMSLKKMSEDSINVIYEQALEVEPDNSRARFMLIQNTWNKQDYDKVIELCRPAQEYNPNEMAFYYFQGLAHFQKNERDEALETFRKGVSQINSDSDPNIVSDFYAIMGDILHEKDLDQEAFAAYDSCLQWKPDNYGCLNNYAYYLSLKGRDLSRAEQMSYKTIKAEPENSTYLDTYAWILFMQKRYEEAKVYIDQAVKNDSTTSDVIIEHAGDIYAMTGEVDKAVEFWQKSVEAGNESAVLQEKIKQRKYIAE
ncbi:MAG: hypothetical protein IJV27_08235 [Prevotella sp.]|nr:hypothetical protein [Prevotella sp.]